jgi:hypothetical protein
MAEATDTYGTAFRNGSVTLLARVVGGDGKALVQADVSSAEYTVFLLDNQNADGRTPIDGHTGVALDVAGLIFNNLLNDDLWSVDAVGYNFRHVLDVSQQPAFTIAGQRYLVQFELAPESGQVILVRFRINVI